MTRGAPKFVKRDPEIQTEKVYSKDKLVEIPVFVKGNKDLVKDLKLISDGTTGSSTFVYRVQTIDNEFFVVKLATNNNLTETKFKRIVQGSRHEKKIYDIMFKLVSMNVTPFVLASIGLKSPDKMIFTETNVNAITLSKFLRQEKPSRKNFLGLFCSLLFTLEVFYRIGLRHNDLHPGNILMFPGNSEPVYLHYTSRDGNTTRTYEMPNNKGWQPRIYDFDRAFKRRRYDLRNEFDSSISSNAVTNRWKWYTEKNTIDYNAFKLYSHLGREIKRSQLHHLYNIIDPIYMPDSRRKQIQKDKQLSERLFLKYHILTNGNREIDPFEFGIADVENLFLKLARPFERSGKAQGNNDYSINNIYN